MSELQSVVFNKSLGHTQKFAKQWLSSHKLEAIKKVDKVNNQLRYRISEPIYKKYYTHVLNNGIHLIIGYY